MKKHQLIAKAMSLNLAPIGVPIKRDDSPPVCVTPTYSPCQVCNGVYLGNHADALDEKMLFRKGIKNIVNIAAECADIDNSTPISPSTTNFPDDKIAIVRFEKNDHCDENITSIFIKATRAIENALLADRGVLVHCRGGHSRAPTTIVAYLMLKYHKTDKEAHEFLAQKYNKRLDPNLGFCLALDDFNKVIDEWKKYTIYRKATDPTLTFLTLLQEFEQKR